MEYTSKYDNSINERDLWQMCKNFVCNDKASQKAFQFYEPKKKLLQLYPYLLSWEIYNFLKYGYEGLHICKNCGEQINKLHVTDFCCRDCKAKYIKNSYVSLKDLWDNAKILCCKYETSRAATNAKRSYNPITILSEFYNIPSRFIFSYLKNGIDIEDIKPVKRTVEYKSWDDLMGVERASIRREKLIARQLGKKHSKEWCNNIRNWYKDPNNLEKFKKSIEHITNSKEIHEKQRVSLLKKIHCGEFTPLSNNRFRSSGIVYDGLNFRSRYEVIYYAYCKYISKDVLKFETIRIPYIDRKLNKERIYITDFYNTSKNQIIEIKPKKYMHELKDKLIGVKNFMQQNDIKYKVITETKLKFYLNELFKIEGINDDAIIKSIFKVYKSWLQ